MQLFLLPGAPNPTKVALYVGEKDALGAQMGLEQTIVNPFKGEQNSPEHLARNPFGTLPVLQTESGQYVFESLPIIEYLEERFPEFSMWGNDLESRGTARNLERVADVRFLTPSATYAHSVNSPFGLDPVPVMAERSKPQFTASLDYFDQLLSDGREFVAGERVTVADCTLQAGLQFLRFRELEDLSGHANVARWSEAFRQRPTAQAVLKF